MAVDLIMVVSSSAILLATLFLVYKLRRESAFVWPLIVFAFHVSTTGAAHLTDIYNQIEPGRGPVATARLAAAAGSILLAAALVFMIPRLLTACQEAKLSGECRREVEAATGVLKQEFASQSDDLELLVREAAARNRDLRMAIGLLRVSEARFRRVAESNMIALAFGNLEGRIKQANDAFLAMFGYRRENLRRHGLRLDNLTAPQHRWLDDKALKQMQVYGHCQPFEKEYTRPDGGRVRVLLGAGLLDVSKTDIVIFALDITERKRAEEVVKASLREKEILLKEIYHRVKNNLQIISSLLDLQSRHIKDPLPRKVLSMSQNRVRSMALIHEKLYQSGDIERIDFAAYIIELVDYLFQAHGADRAAVEPEVEVIDVLLNIDTAIPCGLIISELVSNSLKHAFRECGKGKVRVELRSQPDCKFTLLVSDNGVGLPGNWESLSTESLGLKLVKSLVDQLDATLEIRGGGGASFQVSFSELKYKERR